MAHKVNVICLGKAKEHETSGDIFSLHAGDSRAFVRAGTTLQGCQLSLFTNEEAMVQGNEARYLCCKASWRQTTRNTFLVI